MAREFFRYDERRDAKPIEGAIDADTPIRGLYKMRMVKGGMWIPILLWYGLPADPMTGELMDRSLRWQCKNLCTGELIDVDRAWPRCAADAIDEKEAEYLRQLQAWGARVGHDFNKKIDPLNSPIVI